MIDNFNISNVRRLVSEVYLPFAEEERAILWPNTVERFENDAEHSFSLAVVGMALGEQLGLDPAKITYYATIHDLPELYTGDISVWDEEGRKTKHQNEKLAIERFEIDFKSTPILASAIRQYDSLQDEESKFVYALDKLIALLVVVEGNGEFWKKEGITFEMHLAKAEETKEKIALNAHVLKWFEELLEEVTTRKEELFNS